MMPTWLPWGLLALSAMTALLNLAAWGTAGNYLNLAALSVNLLVGVGIYAGIAYLEAPDDRA